MLRLTIRNRRISLGFSIRQVALYAKVDHSMLSRFEAGKVDLASSKLERVMLFLDISISVPNDRPPTPKDDLSQNI